MQKIGLVQLVSTSSVEKNLQQVNYFLNKAQTLELELVVLPENVVFIGEQPTDVLSVAEDFKTGVIQQEFSRLARQYNLWLIAGTIPLKTKNNRVRSASLVFDNRGNCVARYDKIHLFDVTVGDLKYQESSVIEPGDQIVVVDTPVGKIGLTICYDLRFPELYQQLMQKGAEIFTVCSAFTQMTGEAHWEVLLRARAIENLCYVLAPNQSGMHRNGRKSYGHSAIIGPWGNTIAVAENEPDLITASIDLRLIYQLREQFPCNHHHVL